MKAITKLDAGEAREQLHALLARHFDGTQLFLSQGNWDRASRFCKIIARATGIPTADVLQREIAAVKAGPGEPEELDSEVSIPRICAEWLLEVFDREGIGEHDERLESEQTYAALKRALGRNPGEGEQT